jgi:uncharacterized protein YPO0396
MQTLIPIENNGKLALPGFRLKRLEMLNWGTFNGVVQRLTPDCRWTMLVGTNGSGKSTAADALRTLLVPPARATYNDASVDHRQRQNAKDRTKRTYIRGAYKAASQENSATALVQYLRAEGVQSILLAVFANEYTRSEATLAQILWVQNDKPDQVYLVSRGDRTISKDLVKLGNSREMPKNLRRREFEVDNSFTAYEEKFRRLIGIAGAGALEVFNQAIGVKEVKDLNLFVRNHMLEPTNIHEFIGTHLKPHYKELSACYTAIQRAENQINLLQPLVTNYSQLTIARETKAERTNLKLSLPHYYNQREFELRIALEEQLNAECLTQEKIRDGHKQQQTDQQNKRNEISSAIDNDACGRRLNAIAEQIATITTTRNAKLEQREKLLKQLQLAQHPPTVATQEQFEAMRQRLQCERDPLQATLNDLEARKTDCTITQRDATASRLNFAAEMKSIRDNKVLIPRILLEIRTNLCQATGIPESELPFAGELIEVHPDFQEWTGAIERLLHNFGTSLLVPDNRYFAAANYINHNHLGTRLVFFRVPTNVLPSHSDRLNDPKRVPCRLVFNETKALAPWVKAEVARHFAHTCCDDIQALNQVDYGITPEGLIRDGSRHIKNDKSRVTDRSNYVLGWSTQTKLAAILEQYNAADQACQTATNQLADVARETKSTTTKLSAITAALEFQSFDQINDEHESNILQQLTAEQEELNASSDKLKALKKQLKDTERQLQELDQAIRTIDQTIGGLQQDIQRNQKHANHLKTELHGVTMDVAATEAEINRLFQPQVVTLDNLQNVKDTVSAALHSQLDELSTQIANLEKQIVLSMKDFLTKYPEECAELRADMAFADEFCNLHHRLAAEQLPTHKERFFALLNSNLIVDIATLRSKLDFYEREIRERIAAVNVALTQIKFSATTHVQIVVSQTRTDESNRFKANLKKCTANTTLPKPEDQKQIFTNIQELITRFDKEPEWTARVTDVRNWLDYGVKEICTATKAEAGYYSASSGRSAGQKTLLALTILASAISAQYRLNDEQGNLNQFRLVIVDEAFGKTDEENSQRALEIFQQLGLQLVVVNPFDAKSRIVEDFVDSYHLVTKEDEISSVRRVSRAQYLAARDEEPSC